MALWHRYGWVAYLAVFLGVIGHATSEFVAVLSGVAGPELSVWRFTLGGFGLVVLALLIPSARDLWTPLREAWRALVPLSLFGVSLGYLLFHWSLDYATVPQVATTVTTAPIFVAIVNQWINAQAITRAKWVTGVAALVGVALLVTDGALARLAGNERNLIGIAMVVLNALLLAVYMVLAKPYIARFGALRFTTLTMAIGAVGLWLLVGAAWGVWVNPLTVFERDFGQATALLTIGFYNTTLTQWLWLGGLAAAPDITRASYLFFLKPVIAAVLALLFLAQPVDGIEWLAILVICGAVLVEALWPRLFPAPAATGTVNAPAPADRGGRR